MYNRACFLLYIIMDLTIARLEMVTVTMAA